MRISSLGSAWSCDAVNAFEVLDAASTFEVLDAFSTVVMFDRWFILLGKAYLVFRRSSTCFAKVSAWAHNQQKLEFSSRSHCKKVIIKVKVLFHLKNNLERQLYCEQPFHWFYAGIPNPNLTPMFVVVSWESYRRTSTSYHGSHLVLLTRFVTASIWCLYACFLVLSSQLLQWSYLLNCCNDLNSCVVIKTDILLWSHLTSLVLSPSINAPSSWLGYWSVFLHLRLWILFWGAQWFSFEARMPKWGIPQTLHHFNVFAVAL